MKQWIKTNWRQALILSLSVVDALLMQWRPEWRPQEIVVLGVLAAAGIHLPAISYSSTAAK